MPSPPMTVLSGSGHITNRDFKVLDRKQSMAKIENQGRGHWNFIKHGVVPDITTPAMIHRSGQHACEIVEVEVKVEIASLGAQADHLP